MIGDAEYLRALPEYVEDFDGLCVYFLWLGETLQYVGQTAYLCERIRQHEDALDGCGYGKVIPFDRCTFLEVGFDDLNLVEFGLIRTHRPPFNTLEKTNFRRPRYVNMPRRPGE
jgi:hypothetical protein